MDGQVLNQGGSADLRRLDARRGDPELRASLGGEMLALYEGIADEAQWRHALGRLRVYLGAAGMGVLPGEGGRGAPIAAGIPAPDLDAVRAWLSARAPPPSVTQFATATPSQEYWRLPADVAVKGLSGHHLLVRLDHEGRVIGHADLYRTMDAPEFDAAATGSFLALAPHLARSLALAMRLAAAEARAGSCAQCHDVESFGCALLEDNGSVIEINRTAHDLLTADDGLRISDGRLCAPRAGEDQAIDRRLREVLGDEPFSGPVFVEVPRPSGRRPYVLFMSRIDSSRPAFGVRLPRVRLLIVDTDRGDDVPREVLRALYRLTTTESEVAWHLVNGASLQQAAQRLGIAHNTARHHLERIFAKTGVRRQPDLVRLALSPFVALGRLR